MKKYMAWARVSSREQEREGFSLEVQEDGFREFGRQAKAVVDPIFRIAETATKTEERKAFREMIAFAKRHAHEYDGLLFYKIDRAARNLKDFVELEELESKYGLPFIAITQPVQNTPSGRMMRRTLATMAAFQTEQQSLDVREGIARRVQEGWFPSNPPYGYKAVRRNKRSVVVTHPENSIKVKRVFHLRACEQLTVDEIVKRLFDEGLFYSDSKPKFSPTKVGNMLHDRSYLGFIKFRGQWYPGRHEALIDQATWDQVRVSFGEQVYRSHAMVYASQLIRCGFCGHIVTGEEKLKETKAGTKAYVYYRCSRYRKPGHPRIRLTEKELDAQLQSILDTIRLPNTEARMCVQAIAQARLEADHLDAAVRVEEIRRQLALIVGQREQLLNLRLAGEVDEELFARKRDELDERERILRRKMSENQQLRDRIDEMSHAASDVFEILAEEWLTIERRSRQLALVALFGGFTLEGRILVPTNGTPLELFRAG